SIINPIARSQFKRLGSLKELEPIIDKLGSNAESVLGEALRCTGVQGTLCAIDEFNGRFRGWLYGEKEHGMYALHPQYLGMLLISNHAKREKANALVVRMFNFMESQVQQVRAIAEREVDHFTVNQIALKFITDLDHYLASLVTYMDKEADSRMDLESFHWQKYLQDWSAGLALEMAYVSEELGRERKDDKDQEDSDKDSERTVRNKRRKLQGPNEANMSEELKRKRNDDENQEDRDQDSERTVRDKRRKVREPIEADLVSPFQPFFEARETREDEA
ncbi:MAG: hypothetical protein Q9183_005262, partial [Haloplaca sp. 2 TL-2023]